MFTALHRAWCGRLGDWAIIAQFRVGIELASNLQYPVLERRTSAQQEAIRMLMMILLVLLVFALIGGGVGHSRYGYAGWSPAGILLVILLLWFFTGHSI